MTEDEELAIGISKYSRDNVIDKLKYAFSNDFLDEDVFEKRIEIANNTKSRRELNMLVADLPPLEEMKSSQTSSVALNRGVVRESSTMIGILGGVEKKGIWKPARRTKIIIIMGGVDLDFTKAEIPPGITEIDIYCVMGGLDITVPRGINVELDCPAILGGIEDKASHQYLPDAPTLKIRGFVLLGGIDVKPPKEKLLSRILKKLGLD